MIKRVVVVYEEYQGEAESYNLVFSAFSIYDADKLDAVSKYVLENGLIEKMKEKHGEDIEPMNESEWSFDDIEEEIYHTDEYEKLSQREDYTLDVRTFDLNEKTLKEIYSIYKNHKSTNSQFSSGEYENILQSFFTKNQIKDFDLTNKFDFEIIEKVSLKLNDSNFVFDA